MRSAVLSRVETSRIKDLHLRLDVLDQRGSYFKNPVNAFIATNGPGSLGARIQFQVYLIKGIDSVEILRNTARDFASAAVLQTYALSELAINKPIAYYDHDKAIVGLTTYYWIRVIPKPSKFAPIVQGPQIVAVPATGDTTLFGGNVPLNVTNNATVDSINAGASATARIFGPGGVGTTWLSYKGPLSTVMLPGSISGLAYATIYWVYWTGASFQASTTPIPALPDNFIFAGQVTTVSSGGSALATATAVLAGTGVASVTMSSNGSGYTSAPTVSFSGGGGTGAAGTAVLGGTLGQQVMSVTITSPGTGYTSAPGIAFNAGGGSGAAGTVSLVSTSVAQITVNSGGSGYTGVPLVSITGGGGSNGTATATIASGAVSAVSVGNAGSGYTSAPAVGFSGGQSGSPGGGFSGGGGVTSRGGGRLLL